MLEHLRHTVSIYGGLVITFLLDKLDVETGYTVAKKTGKEARAGRTRGSAKPTLTKEAVASALEQAGGIVADAAKLLQCSRQTLYDWLNAEPDLQKIRATADAILQDDAIGRIAQAIRTDFDPTDRKQLPGFVESVRTSRWYLERRDRRFQPNAKIEAEDTTIVVTLDPTLARLRKQAEERWARENGKSEEELDE